MILVNWKSSLYKFKTTYIFSTLKLINQAKKTKQRWKHKVFSPFTSVMKIIKILQS